MSGPEITALMRGSLSVVEGKLSAALASFQACLEIFTDLGDKLWQAYTRRALGYAHQQHGRFAEAIIELEAALPVFGEHEDSMWEAHTSLTLGLDSLRLNDGQDVFGRSVDPLKESQYPILGDASILETRTASHSWFSARLERGFNWAAYGDLQAPPLTPAKISAGRGLATVAAR